MTNQDWQNIRLDQAFPFTSKPRGLNYLAYAFIPFIPMELIPDDRLYINRYVEKRGDEISSGTYVEDGDFLVSKITPCFENGKQGIVKNLPLPFAVATTEVIPFKDIEGLSDRRYLAYYLRRSDVRSTLAQKMVGTTGRQRLGKDALSSLQIDLPPLPIQEEIIKILLAVEQAKEARQQELTLERERKVALMDHLFTHGTRNESRKQTEIGAIPETWEVVKLSRTDLCRVRTSFPTFAKIPELDSQNECDALVLGLKVSDMTLPGNEHYISSANISFRCPSTNTKLLRSDSIVFPKRGAAIATNKKRLTKAFSILDPNLIAVEPTEKINPDFLFAFFERFDLRTLQDNTPIPQLNKHNVEGIKLPFPSITEQEEIGAIQNACFANISSLESEISLLDELFQAVLEELMTGRLSTQPLLVETKEAVAI